MPEGCQTLESLRSVPARKLRETRKIRTTIARDSLVLLSPLGKKGTDAFTGMQTGEPGTSLIAPLVAPVISALRSIGRGDGVRIRAEFES
jgi:hypothetical protein